MQVHLFAFFLFLQSFVSCQPAQQQAQPLAIANSGFQYLDLGLLSVEEARKPTAGIVFRSMDGGQTWQDVSAGLPRNLQVLGLFASDGEVFLGAENGLYRSNSYAAPAWRQEVLLSGRITAVAPGRAGLYAGGYGHGLLQNVAGTDIWRDLTGTLKEKTIQTVLESSDGALFVGTDNGIFKSADGGQTWKQVFSDGLILNIVEANGILIGGGLQGVLRSTDRGEHWEYALNENILAKKTGLIKDSFVTILGTRDPSKINPDGITSRLRASADGGKTWQRMEQSLLPLQGIYDMDERLSKTRDIYDIIQVGEYLFCSFDTGIYRSSDQGKRWELVLPAKGQSGFNFAVSGQVIYAVPGGGC
ncbi:MAG: hypothetical protein KF852_05840 [Saprospiraceae bacterium]|nr:hypothetical protein [Saprospiraceae bacterium]